MPTLLIKHTSRSFSGFPTFPGYACSSFPIQRTVPGEVYCHSSRAKTIFQNYLPRANFSNILTSIPRHEHIKDGFEMAVRISIFLKLTRFFYLVGIYHSRHFLHSTPDHRTFEEIFFALNWHLRTWIINCRPSIGGRENTFVEGITVAEPVFVLGIVSTFGRHGETIPEMTAFFKIGAVRASRSMHTGMFRLKKGDLLPLRSRCQ